MKKQKPTALTATATGKQSRTKLPWWVYDLLEDTNNFRTFWITKGLGAGGTYGAVIWHLMMCRINYQSRYSWAIGPTFRVVETTLIPTFTEILYEVFGLTEGVHYKVVKGRHPKISIFGWRQEIDFFSADAAERMVGPSISHWSGTELGLWKRTAFEKANARLRCKKAFRLQRLGEGTPEGYNWWEVEANFLEGVDFERNYRRIILHTSDNPVLDKDYVKNLIDTYRYDPQKLQSYLYGLFVAFTRGTAYWNFVQSRNVLRQIPKQNPYMPILFCWDFNRVPLAWVAMQKEIYAKGHFTRYERWVAQKESSGKSRGLYDAVVEFGAHYPLRHFQHTPIEIYGGHDGYTDRHNTPQCDFRQIKDYLAAAGYTNVSILADKAAPGIRTSLEKMAVLMEYGMFVISPECTKTINGFEKTSLKDGTWVFDKPAGETWTHYADGPRYCLYQLNKFVNIINPDIGEVYGINL